MTDVCIESQSLRFPRRGWLGIALVLVFWAVNWSFEEPYLRTHWAFFPLWLGYCLSVDALVYWRKGSSMISRSPAAYVALFLISAPGWWLFELLNLRTQNWEYRGAEYFTNLEYFLLCSLSFSTVMPAVFGTAELVGTWGWLDRFRRGPRVSPQPIVLALMFVAGWTMLALLLFRPVYFFPFLWASVYLIVEPINAALGNPTLLRFTAKGDWRAAVALAVGCLICGFFWEMWNYYSFPKWIYHVPFVDFARIFEMPLLGYLGYIPFSWELFAMYHLTLGMLHREGRLVQIVSN
jgi:hypothetical protein